MTIHLHHILRIHLTILSICFSQGCTHTTASNSPLEETVIRAFATTAPTTQSPAQLTTLLLENSKGEYYMGDHLTKNLTLTLLPGQTYSLTWHGCQGLYGAAIGKWQIKSDRLLLESIDQSGRLAEYPLTALHIRLLTNNSPALIPDADLPNFLKDGVADNTCCRPFNLILWR